MVIQILAPVKFGGGERFISLLSKQFNKAGVEQRFVLLSRSNLFELALDELKIPYERLTNVELSNSPNLIKYIFCLFYSLIVFFLKYRKSESESVILAHGFPSNIFAYLFYRKSKKVYVNHSEKAKISKIIEYLYGYILKNFNKIVCVGPNSFYAFTDIFPSLLSQTIRIDNGIDPEFSQNKIVRNYITGELKGVYVARFSESKNHIFLLDVLEHIPTLKVTLVGDGAALAPLKLELAKRGLRSRVELLGEIKPENVVGLLKDFHVMLFPSLNEGFGMVIAESISNGLPVIAFKSVYHNIFGRACVVSNSEKEFIFNVKGLLEKGRVSSLSTDAVDIADNFSISNCADKYIETLNLLK
jgi:hypothetical protein